MDMDENRGKVLIVGAGVAGIRAAFDLAESGHQVLLTESSPAIGGILAKLDYQFPTDHCGMCRMLPFIGREDATQHCMRKSLSHRGITIMPDTTVVACDGEPGSFEVTLRRRNRWVDTDRCIGCGDCVDACPVEVPDPFNQGLTKHKAIYRPVPHNLPNLYDIDRAACTECGDCVQVCPVDAIQLGAPDTEETEAVGAVILATGTDLYDARTEPDFYGYSVSPNVVTSLELERMLSGTRRKLHRPNDGQEVGRIAWLQCVGSRNRAKDRDYCSSICCMFALKEAVLAKELGGPELEATIFYMDLRTFGKDYHRYRVKAEREHGVRTIRCRAHCVTIADDGTPSIRYFGDDGEAHDETFDLVVLATGQSPPADMESVSEVFGVERDAAGFLRTDVERSVRTSREGIFACGSLTGLRDISEALILGDSAAAEAAQVLRDKGKGEGEEEEEAEAPISQRSSDRERPRIALILTGWPETEGRPAPDLERIAALAGRLPAVTEVHRLDRVPTYDLDEIRQILAESAANRVLLAATLPHVYGHRLVEVAQRAGITPSLVRAIDLVGPLDRLIRQENGADVEAEALSLIRAAAAELAVRDPSRPSQVPIEQRALVVGGGVSGMQSALVLARQGVDVVLVERGERLGGHALNLRYVPEGFDPRALAQSLAQAVETEPRIRVLLGAEVLETRGSVGRFRSRVSHPGGDEIVLHGATIVATGGREAPAGSEYGYGQNEAVLTQEELEQGLADGAIGPERLGTVVMIQCVGSRVDGGREYCSRLCCGSALKNAAKVLELNPEARVMVLYRDLMAYGFKERLYTEARSQGVIFATYDPEAKPVVEPTEKGTQVTYHDGVLGQDVRAAADLVVLSTGVVPNDGAELAERLGVDLDDHGFYREADPKWRPVETSRQGVYVCGLANSPRSISEAIAMAGAAAERALSVLSRELIPAARITSSVKRARCAVCELCVRLCPYDARSLDRVEGRILVDELSCQGCGICAAACPSGAATLEGRTTRQVMAELDGFLAGL